MKGIMNTRAKKLQKWWQKHFPIDRVLAQRIAKCTVNSTLALIFCLIPKVREHLGAQPALLPLISVMVHPGRRISGTIQGVIFCIAGLILGLAYALFGRFLAQRCLGHNWKHLSEAEQYTNHFVRYESALAILAVFETFMLFFHGWMRSVSHHYFAMVFPLFLVVHFAFLDPLSDPHSATAKAYSVPFYLGIAMTIFWNLALFPEFGSTYLGNSTIDTMNLIHKAVDDSVNFFLSIDIAEDQSLYAKRPESLSKLLKSKPTIHSKVSTCSMVFHECIYEISYSYLSPTQLKPIIDMFKPCSTYINGLINACQLEFTLLGRDQNRGGDVLEMSTNKENAHADFEKFCTVLGELKLSIYNSHKILSESIYMTKVILAHAYDVNLSRVKGPEVFKDNNEAVRYKKKKEFLTDLDIDKHRNTLENALEEFNREFRKALLNLNIDLLNPKDEMFLLSSFLMNFKETMNSVISMLDHVKDVHNSRKIREGKGWLSGKSVWVTFFNSFQSFNIWIKGGYAKINPINENQGLKGGIFAEENQNIGFLAARRPSVAEKDLLSQQVGSDRNLRDLVETSDLPLPASLPNRGPNESSTSSKSKRGKLRNLSYHFIATLIKINNFCKRSKAHFRFGFQVAIALMLASFPMFIPKTREWYINFRGTWVGFVCILCLEPSVGGTFWSFFLRMLGVIIGSSWAYLSYAASSNQSDPYLETVITAIGAVPGFYFFLGTPYVRAAIIGIISIYIVLLAAVTPSPINDSILTAWAKRCFAVGYGGGVALIVQLIMFPSKARDELNQEIAFVCGSISELELLYATGLEGESWKISLSAQKYKRMSRISQTAKSALTRADGYKGLARQEPRLKGEYTELEKVFTQVIFILRQILDRIDNVALLRKQNGSVIIEELNSGVYPYRRQIIASICCLMRAMQEAFLNKTPLPQFLPSPRVAHRRLIKMVHRALQEKYKNQFCNGAPILESNESQDDNSDDEHELVINVKRQKENGNNRQRVSPHEFALKERFLTWNASTVALEEIIEYIEELSNLTKILVGINEFKYGFLSRPLYEDWAAEAATGFDNFIQGKRLKRQQDFTFDREANIPESPDSTAASSSPGEGENPVALHHHDTKPSLNLARIASHKVGHGDEGLPPAFRKRAFSIVSVGDQLGNLSGLTKKKTLGDTDSEIEKDEDTSDDELPLGLKRVLSVNKGTNI